MIYTPVANFGTHPLCQKSSESFSIFFSLKNTNLRAHFLFFTIFDNFKFYITLWLKWCSISADTSPLVQFSKFNHFLWVCWFLGKYLSNFVPPAWKLHNPYCHNDRLWCCLSKELKTFYEFWPKSHGFQWKR